MSKNKTDNDLVILKQRIEQKRAKMHELLKAGHGLNKQNVYKTSMELDELIVQYHKAIKAN